MGTRIWLTGLLALACGLESVHAQTAAAPEVVQCRADCKPAPRFPLLTHLISSMHSSPGPLQPPQPGPVLDPVPSKEDIARMVADGDRSPAEITAAKIKADEAQAKARQAAVRYLGTVDCHYYPEAETGLIGGLRADRSESVRYEAAIALGTCRGTTARMLEALHVCATGAETDGNPSESSDKVRAAARESLNRTLSSGMAMYAYAPPPMLPPMPALPAPEWTLPDPSVQPVGYFTPLYTMPTYAMPTYPAFAYPAPASAPSTHAPAPPASAEERAQAERVGTNPPAPPAGAHSMFDWFQRHLLWRASFSGNTHARSDPRMRGLAPLGSDTSLAIPASPVQPAYLPMPYNDR